MFIFVLSQQLLLKKFLVIVLLTIHLYNMGGYEVLFSFLELKSSAAIVERLDGGGFTDSQLIEVKIPYPLPYAASQSEFERFDGEIDVDGVHYNYVKRKMVNDTLIVLCIPNTVKTELTAAKSDLVAGFNALQSETPEGQKSNAGATAKPFTFEYNSTANAFVFGISSDLEINFYVPFSASLMSNVMETPYLPPRV
jgi:hypothetical protein